MKSNEFKLQCTKIWNRKYDGISRQILRLGYKRNIINILFSGCGYYCQALRKENVAGHKVFFSKLNQPLNWPIGIGLACRYFPSSQLFGCPSVRAPWLFNTKLAGSALGPARCGCQNWNMAGHMFPVFPWFTNPDYCCYCLFPSPPVSSQQLLFLFLLGSNVTHVTTCSWIDEYAIATFSVL